MLFLNFVCRDGGISNFWAVLNNVYDGFSMKVGGFLLGYVPIWVLGLGLTGIFPKPELFRSWFGRFEFIFTRIEGLNHEEVS